MMYPLSKITVLVRRATTSSIGRGNTPHGLFHQAGGKRVHRRDASLGPSILLALCLVATACQAPALTSAQRWTPVHGATPSAPLRTRAPVASSTPAPAATAPPPWAMFSDTKYVTDMAFDHAGRLWVATLHGVVRWDLDSGSTCTYTVDDGLAGKNVECVAVAPDGALWFGLRSAGVSRFDLSAGSGRVGQSWTSYTDDDGLADNRVQDIAVGPDGALWFGTYGGVSRFDDHSWTTYTDGDGLAGGRILSIAVHPDGSLWFGTFGNGVSRFDGVDWSTYTTDHGLADNRVRDIAVGPGGILWFATFGGGVSRFDPSARSGQGDENWTTYTTDDGLAENVLSCIAVAPDGTIWAGAADNGISRFDGQNWTKYTTAHGLVDNETWSIVAEPDGTVWASSINGISRHIPSPRPARQNRGRSELSEEAGS